MEEKGTNDASLDPGKSVRFAKGRGISVALRPRERKQRGDVKGPFGGGKET